MVTNVSAGLNFTSGQDFGVQTTFYSFESSVNGGVYTNNNFDRLWDYVIKSFGNSDGRFEVWKITKPVIISSARETDRQVDRQTDRQTDRQADRQTVPGGECLIV